ncbi:L-serine ammonia-lyase, iron-sulfur-dependent, subunit alpha [bacterium]|nr:L-serine ammonia-lyase, iron-sulfur-dependent, subunit alpha [bacterium]
MRYDTSDNLDEIYRLIKNEIKLVAGCTEPASIALAVSIALKTMKSKLGFKTVPKDLKVRLSLSSEVYRNVSTVIIPMLKKKGVKPAVVCGIYSSGKTLDMFSKVSRKNSINAAELYKKNNWLKIVKLNKRGIYIKAKLKCGKNEVTVIISKKHDNISVVKYNSEFIFIGKNAVPFKIKGIEHISEIVATNNRKLEGIAKSFIVSMGKLKEKHGFSETFEAIRGLTEMRMSGEAVSISTITGSGNQGIFLSIPLYEIYEKSGENVIPAVLFSILTQIYLTQKKGRISEACGLANPNYSYS